MAKLIMEEQYFLISTVRLLYFEILVDLEVFRSTYKNRHIVSIK